MTVEQLLGKILTVLDELLETVDPEVTIQRVDQKVVWDDEKGRCEATHPVGWRCDLLKGHHEAHWNRMVGFWSPEPTTPEPTPKWRELVDKNSALANDPLPTVLYNIYAAGTVHPDLHYCLARIVAVCEQQAPGWKAKPYESNDFSTFQLVSAFGSVLRNPAEPALRDWQALGEEAASWLKHLTEDDDE